MMANAIIQSVTVDTGIAVGLVITLVGAAISCTWWIGKRLTKIDSMFQKLGARLDGIEQRELDNLTLAQAEVLALRLAINNPGMSVPDPRDPSKMIDTPKD